MVVVLPSKGVPAWPPPPVPALGHQLTGAAHPDVDVFLQTHGGLFGQLLDDLLISQPHDPIAFLLGELAAASTPLELEQAGLLRHHDHVASSSSLLLGGDSPPSRSEDKVPVVSKSIEDEGRSSASGTLSSPPPKRTEQDVVDVEEDRPVENHHDLLNSGGGLTSSPAALPAEDADFPEDHETETKNARCFLQELMGVCLETVYGPREVLLEEDSSPEVVEEKEPSAEPEEKQEEDVEERPSELVRAARNKRTRAANVRILVDEEGDMVGGEEGVVGSRRPAEVRSLLLPAGSSFATFL